MSNERGIFKHYFDFPIEIRAMIIEKMSTIDRCRFMRSSKQCSKEVQSSKKFSYSIQADFISKNYIYIVIRYGNNEGGYDLSFTSELGRNFMTYFGLDGRLRWMIQLLNSETIVEHAMQHFEMTLQNYQKSIKTIRVAGWLFRSQLNKFRFEVESFNRLEELYVQDDIDIVQFVSKSRLPLKRLNGVENQNCQGLENCEEIYQISEHLLVPHLRLNINQFKLLTASEVSIHIGDLEVIDIYNFILSWQHGFIRDNFQSCEWRLDGSNFNDQQLFDLLGGKFMYNNLVKTGIENYKEPWKTACLTSSRYYVMKFVTSSRNMIQNEAWR